MGPWLIAWIVVSIVATLLLIAFAVALVRHGLALGRSAQRMSEELAPLTEEIARGSDRASAHAANLPRPAGRREPRR